MKRWEQIEGIPAFYWLFSWGSLHQHQLRPRQPNSSSPWQCVHPAWSGVAALTGSQIPISNTHDVLFMAVLVHSLRPTQWAQGREGEWGQCCLCRGEGAGQGCWVPNVHLSLFSCQGLDQTPGWLGINGATCKKMCSLTFLRHLPRNQGNRK